MVPDHRLRQAAVSGRADYVGDCGSPFGRPSPWSISRCTPGERNKGARNVKAIAVRVALIYINRLNDVVALGSILR